MFTELVEICFTFFIIGPIRVRVGLDIFPFPLGHAHFHRLCKYNFFYEIEPMNERTGRNIPPLCRAP